MAAIPYMPLYVADYLSDAAHLSTLEHGAYLLLIMTYWQRGEALPADDKKLARICRVGPREWARIKPAISEFFQVDCNNWSHRRIESELQNVRAKSLKKRAGGLARAKQMHSNCSPTAQQSDTDTDTYSSVTKVTGAASDPAKALWDSAKAYIGPSKASLIGKWCAEYGNPVVSSAITTAMLASPQPPDRVAYVIGILKRSKANAEEIPIA